LRAKAAVVGMSFVEQRAAFARELAMSTLGCKPGEGFGYSNAGFALLSAAAEVAAKKPWEELVIERLAMPLGMTSFGFGVPPRDAASGGALGHNEDGEVDETEDLPWHHASFSVHSTFHDWALFARMHLRALRGDCSALKVVGVGASSAALLHTPVSPAFLSEMSRGPEKPMSMAMGWQCLWEEPSDGKPWLAERTGILYHFGTNFRFNAGMYLCAEPPLLMLVASNSGSSLAKLAGRLALEAVIGAGKVDE